MNGRVLSETEGESEKDKGKSRRYRKVKYDKLVLSLSPRPFLFEYFKITIFNIGINYQSFNFLLSGNIEVSLWSMALPCPSESLSV